MEKSRSFDPENSTPTERNEKGNDQIHDDGNNRKKKVLRENLPPNPNVKLHPRARIIIKHYEQFNTLQDNHRNSETRKQRRLKNDL
jgi:hypothetical protein